MKVTLEPFVGNSLHDGRPVKFEQYRIRVDGAHAGLIGFAPGSKVLLHTKFGPIETKEIETQVATLLERESVTSSQSPNVPEELLAKEEDDVEDDFDA